MTATRPLAWALRLVPVCVAVACFAPFAACSSAPTHQAIVYEAAVSGATNVFTIDPSTGASTQLTHGARFSGNPAWSIDYRRIIFSSQRDGQAQNDLYTMAADSSDVRRLTDTPDAGEYSAKFSPDGKSIAYVRQSTDGWTLWLMDADGAHQRRIANPYAFAEFPAWTHDGREVYYSAMPKADTSGAAYDGARIYSADVATGVVRVRISTPGGDVCPHFSRDGKRLTYAATGTAGQLDIFAHDVSSGDTTGAHDTQITHDPARDDYANASPDDRTMVFVSDRDGNPELYLMNRDGTHERRLTNTATAHENVPDW